MDIPQTPNTNPAPVAPEQPASPPVSAPAPAPAPAPAFNLSAAPASVSATTPDSVRSFMPSAPATAQGLPKTGFFSGKVLTALIALAAILGGVALGYFVFPKPFYNYIGKYLGLPAPASLQEQAPAAAETESAAATAKPAAETESAPAEPTAQEQSNIEEKTSATAEVSTGVQAQTAAETSTGAQVQESAGTVTEEIIDLGATAAETGTTAITEQPAVNLDGKVPRNRNN